MVSKWRLGYSSVASSQQSPAEGRGLRTLGAEPSGWHSKVLAVIQQSLLQSFNNYLLSTFSVPDTIPSIASRAANKRGESAHRS